MAIYSEMQFYKDILDRNLTPQMKETLEYVEKHPPVKETCFIRSDPNKMVHRRRTVKKRYDKGRIRNDR